MKEEKFGIILIIKKFILNLDDVLCRYPNREKVLKDRIKVTAYDIMELIYLANYINISDLERINVQTKLLSKISLLDFLFEESYLKGYITEAIFDTKVGVLKDLKIKIKVWLNYGKSNV